MLRKCLLNISGAYSTTSTAALQVIEGILPLHVKAQMESILVTVGRHKRDCSWEGTNFSNNDYQHPQPPLQILRADFNLENRISFEGQPLFSPTEIYTDDSKLDGGTGCAFCVFEGTNHTFQWISKLQSFNSVFKAEIFAVN
ncbi:hypothetical protein AVEN_96179-1 [Araneus ventricosus]|uniref:Uncharacterized protein n=1 Tax=Araneus ventricosus TaxID=182803 RepID=A0A4Y2FQP7_ARAVE|nr:hypothetical protein AVEN_96179-1 [Araneus ventricosus]